MTSLHIEFFLIRRGDEDERYPVELPIKHPQRYFAGGMKTIREALETDDEERAEWVLAGDLKPVQAAERLIWRIARKPAIITR